MASVRDIDRGWKKFQTQISILDDGFTKIGVQQGAVHKGKGTSDLVKIAAANELGTKHIPSRPAHRIAFDINQTRINEFKGRLYDRVIGGMKANKALGLLGEFHTANIKRSITKLRTPPNKPSTIKKKGSTNPLIDTGQMRTSITHVESI